jgi:hypothetical protein
MDIRNKPVQGASAPLFETNAVGQILYGLEHLGERTTMTIGGKVLTMKHNVSVKGSEARDVSKSTPVYRDALGRLTTEPVGKAAVGLIIWGGTGGRDCHVGMYP